MTDYVTAEEAQRWHDGLGIKNHADADRLMRTVVHQAGLLAEARKALQQIASGRYTNAEAIIARATVAVAALARLDTQEES